MSEIIVLTYGVFDLLHPGHMRLLRKAREYGTRLIVGVNSDESTRLIRASDKRPVLPELDRAYMLRHIACVDEVRIFNEINAADLIYSIRPRFVVKGSRIPIQEWQAIRSVYAQFVKLDPLPSHPHSTELIERAHDIFLDEQGLPCRQRNLR